MIQKMSRNKYFSQRIVIINLKLRYRCIKTNNLSFTKYYLKAKRALVLNFISDTQFLII